jgi:hypothetical protein
MRSPRNDEGSGQLSGFEKAVELVKKIQCDLPATATKTGCGARRFTGRFTKDASGIVEDWLTLMRPGRIFVEELEEFANKSEQLGSVVSNRDGYARRSREWAAAPSTETLYC